MKSITLHNMDDELAEKLTRKAKVNASSLNKTAQQLLRHSLGLATSGEQRADFSEFLGCWSQDEAKEFDRNTQDMNEVDPRDWE